MLTRISHHAQSPPCITWLCN